MEEALDELIKDCAHQLFDLTDDKENAKYPFNSCIALTCGFGCQHSSILALGVGWYHRYAVILDNETTRNSLAILY